MNDDDRPRIGRFCRGCGELFVCYSARNHYCSNNCGNKARYRANQASQLVRRQSDPTEEEIKSMCAEFRAGWTESDWISRSSATAATSKKRAAEVGIRIINISQLGRPDE